MQAVIHVTDTFARRYEAEPSSVALARADLARFASEAGASEVMVDSVRLAISEAVTNAVTHAYPNEPGHVRVLASVEDDTLEVIVSDDGCGVHSGSERAGLGVGLALICAVSDQMTLVPRAHGGTEVRMRFGLLVPDSGAAVGRL